jgi:hypothetical protein
MESPARAIRYIHQAIKHEAKLLAESDGPLDAARVAFFAKVLHLHNAGEEASVFPSLDARVKDVVPSYLLDHSEEQQLVRDLVDGKPGAAARLQQHLVLHIKKEEELLVPLIERTFTIAEMGADVGRMMAVFSPADMAEVLPWLIGSLGVDDRLGYVAFIERAMPPDRFGGILGLLRGKLAPDVWQSLGR